MAARCGVGVGESGEGAGGGRARERGGMAAGGGRARGGRARTAVRRDEAAEGARSPRALKANLALMTTRLHQLHGRARRGLAEEARLERRVEALAEREQRLQLGRHASEERVARRAAARPPVRCGARGRRREKANDARRLGIGVRRGPRVEVKEPLELLDCLQRLDQRARGLGEHLCGHGARTRRKARLLGEGGRVDVNVVVQVRPARRSAARLGVVRKRLALLEEDELRKAWLWPKQRCELGWHGSCRDVDDDAAEHYGRVLHAHLCGRSRDHLVELAALVTAVLGVYRDRKQRKRRVGHARAQLRRRYGGHLRLSLRVSEHARLLLLLGALHPSVGGEQHEGHSARGDGPAHVWSQCRSNSVLTARPRRAPPTPIACRQVNEMAATARKTR